MSKFLPTGQAVRSEVRKIFTRETGRRVALVAFVGGDAEAYLPRPKGLQLICWPQPTGTNPRAIRRLQKQGVKVMFAPRLHMKVYWTASSGAVVASSNLSANAYGSGDLHEAGVAVPSRAIDIDALLKRVKPEPVTPRTLGVLERAWKENKAHASHPRAYPQQGTFADWFEAPLRKRWVLYSFGGYGLSGSRRLRDAAKESSGRVVDCLCVRRGEVKEEDFVLCAYVGGRTEGTRIEWFYAHRVVLVAKSDRQYQPGLPYQAGQFFRLAACPPPPFRLDSALRRAIRSAYQELSGTRALSLEHTRRPSKSLLETIYRHYQGHGTTSHEA